MNLNDFYFRFYDKYTKTDTCWNWNGAKTSLGYGNLWLHKDGKRVKNMYAHRVSWLLYRGAIPDSMNVLHKCDNRKCVNPEHLFLGTQKDNMRDKIEKDRAGIRPHMPDQEVRDIRQLVANGETMAEVSKKYGVHYNTIFNIIHRKRCYAYEIK